MGRLAARTPASTRPRNESCDPGIPHHGRLSAKTSHVAAGSHSPLATTSYAVPTTPISEIGKAVAPIVLLWSHMAEATSSFRRTARAIILRGDKLLTFTRGRIDSGGVRRVWSSIPGGQIEAGETPLDAVRRELLEEMGVVIGQESLLAIQTVFPDAQQHYWFACSIVSGIPTLQTDSEESTRIHREHQSYVVRWTQLMPERIRPPLYWAYNEALSAVMPLLTVPEQERVPLQILTVRDSTNDNMDTPDASGPVHIQRRTA